MGAKEVVWFVLLGTSGETDKLLLKNSRIMNPITAPVERDVEFFFSLFPVEEWKQAARMSSVGLVNAGRRMDPKSRCLEDPMSNANARRRCTYSGVLLSNEWQSRIRMRMERGITRLM